MYLSGDPQKIHLVETPLVKSASEGTVELF
jgi:hypothetical protein